jgi:hypothetical protein
MAVSTTTVGYYDLNRTQKTVLKMQNAEAYEMEVILHSVVVSVYSEKYLYL